MNELLLIIEIIKTRMFEEREEADKCRAIGLAYAEQYASGKAAAYAYAWDLLRAYTAEHIPWTED